jgi:hypothetical protein
MPLLIVPSHNSSPESLKNKFGVEYPISSISRKQFLYRESKWAIGSWIVVPTIETLDKILTSPEHEFRRYDYELERQLLDTVHIENDDREYSETILDYEDPSCQKFWKCHESWFSSIGLVTKDSQYSNAMHALIEVMWDLPIVPVLQAELFNPKNFDFFSAWNDSWNELTQEMLSSNYPDWILAYPKRIWPEFYHAKTWESILRISHHPDKDNSPHYNAFATDPRLWNIEESDDMNVIIEKIKANLMPIINTKIEEINQSHVRFSKNN